MNPCLQIGKAQRTLAHRSGTQPGQQAPSGTGPIFSPGLHSGGKH